MVVSTALCTPACQNGGRCVDVNKCTCVGGWQGARCQIGESTQARLASVLSFTTENKISERHFSQCCFPITLSDICIQQSQFSVRNRAGMVECAWASTGVAVLKDLRARSVKRVSVPRMLLQDSLLCLSLLTYYLFPTCSCDHPLCAPLSTWSYLQSTQYLYLSRGHCGPAL